MLTALGPIVTADEVCLAVEATLRAWLPVAIDAMGVADDFDTPHTYRQVPSTAALHEADLPAAGISSPGWATAPVRDEDGNLRAVWRVNVVFYLRGEDYEATQRNTRNMAAAAATILAQQKTLMGFAHATAVVGENYGPLVTESRTLGEAIIEVDVTVDDARNDLAAPDGPPPTPLPGSPATVAVTVDVRHAAAATP